MKKTTILAFLCLLVGVFLLNPSVSYSQVATFPTTPSLSIPFGPSAITASTTWIDVTTLENRDLHYWTLTWKTLTALGTVPTCQIKAEKANTITGTGAADLITDQACTTTGETTTALLGDTNYVRINLDTKSGTGVIVAVLTGYRQNPYGSVSTSGGGGGGGAVTISGGQAADGAAVSGFPVRIAVKDGSGNTQDVAGDTNGDINIVGVGTAGAASGGILTVQGASSMTPLLVTLSGTNTVTTVTTVSAVTAITNALPAGTNLLGKVGIDQTTPGTTNLVYIKGTDGSSITATTDPCVGATKLYFPINVATNTTTVVQANSASNKYYLCSLFLFASAADNVAVVEDATGSCASPDAGVIGGTTTTAGIQLIANEGVMIQNGGGTVAKTASTNVNLCIITSTSAQLTGGASGVLAP